MKKTAAVVLTVLHLVTSGLIYPQAMTVTKVNAHSMKIFLCWLWIPQNLSALPKLWS
jgi:hypothetical protein